MEKRQSRQPHKLQIAGSSPAPGSCDVQDQRDGGSGCFGDRCPQGSYLPVRAGHVEEKVCGTGLTWVTGSVGATDAMSTKCPSQAAPRSVGFASGINVFER